MGDDQKKDLTSLIELSALEMAKHPPPPGGDPSMTPAPIEKVTAEDFGDLEEMSKQAAKAAAAEVAAGGGTAAPSAIENPSLPADQIQQLQNAVETPPGEAPSMDAAPPPPAAEPAPPEATPTPASDLSIPGMELPAAATAPAEGSSIDLPSHSQIDTSPGALPELSSAGIPGMGEPQPILAGESEPGESPIAAAPVADALAMPPEPSIPAPEPVAAAPAPTPAPEPEPSIASAPPAPAAAAPAPAPKPAPHHQTVDPNRPAVNAPPAGAVHAKKATEPPAKEQNLADVKKFGEKLAIGRPRIEGAPAFSVLIKSETGEFSDKTRKAIETIVGGDDYGIRVEEVAIQLSAGKLLVPQISEFAAVTLAQKLRDVVDTLEVGPASDIFKGSAADLAPVDDSFLLDVEQFESHREEVHDIGAEPRSENELFTSHLAEMPEFQVTRILSAITATSIVNAEIAEAPEGKAFEGETEKLTNEIIARAFKLGAHGVLGLTFQIRPMEGGHKDSQGRVHRAYRLFGTGTAVRARRRDEPHPLAEETAAPAAEETTTTEKPPHNN
jgi:hypothetical protein